MKTKLKSNYGISRICIYFLSVFILIESSDVFAQKGKDGTSVISSLGNVVNEYTNLTANAVSGNTAITVANSPLNSNSRFSASLASGDLIMIIQMQGASILGAPSGNAATPADSTWGAITNYNNCGNYEFAEVLSVPNATTINLDCPIINNYTATGKVQVIRIPRYLSLTINNGGEITCDAWNGTVGGVAVVEVFGNTIINAGGKIDVSTKGFRGGQLDNNSDFYKISTASTISNDGAEKGESIAGFQSDYDIYGGRYCRGAAANGGGGGDAHNAAGGGGANGGNPLLWNGHGNPDVSTPAWISAWNLEFAGFASLTSSGGGQGGYSFSGMDWWNDQDATVTGPGNVLWNEDYRRAVGGFGGRPLDYSTGKIFLGGAGGAGDQDNNVGGMGGSGGGLIYLMSYGTVGGSGQIISNGQNGLNAVTISYADAAGGGGAGGTLIVNSLGNISGISIIANGGKGGDQTGLATYEAEGPGGGGSGGYIAVSNGTPVLQTNGGVNGTTNSLCLTEFPPNGATKGGAGSTATGVGAVTNFNIIAQNDTICDGGYSTTLTASLVGTVPVGTTIIWYDSIVAGNVVGTGNTFVTPVLNNTKTYYVSTCPGHYRDSVKVIIVPNLLSVNLGKDTTLCSGGPLILDAQNTGSTYKWSTGETTKIIAVTTTGNYSVTVSNGHCSDRDTIHVTLNSQINVNLGNDTNICTGNSLTLDAGNTGSTYKWNTSKTTQTIDVVSSGSYSVTVTNGACTGSDNIQVAISPQPNVNLGKDTTLCTGNTLILDAKNSGSAYHWSTGDASKTIVVDTTGTYSVTVTNGLCSDRDTIIISAGILPIVDIGKDTTLCAGNTLTLDAKNTGSLYNWSTNVSSQTISVTTSGIYSVTVSKNGCSERDTIAVTFNTVPIVNLGLDETICGSDPVELDAQNVGCTYKWSIGETTQTITISTSGTYSVTVTNSPCSASDEITIVYFPYPTGEAGNDVTISNYGSTQLNASGGSHYSWSPATGLSETNIKNPTADPRSTTTYTVTVSDDNGCTATDQVTVTVNDIDCGAVYVPTAFSPNGDGKNDVLNVHGKCIKSMQFIVYDRWGEKVFESENQATGWDGKYKGKKLEAAAFRYFLKATMLDDSTIEQHGDINLMK